MIRQSDPDIRFRRDRRHRIKKIRILSVSDQRFALKSSDLETRRSRLDRPGKCRSILLYWDRCTVHRLRDHRNRPDPDLRVLPAKDRIGLRPHDRLGCPSDEICAEKLSFKFNDLQSRCQMRFQDMFTDDDSGDTDGSRHLQDFCPRFRQHSLTFSCSHLCTSN